MRKHKNQFITRLCRSSGIPFSTFINRRDRGWSLEKALYHPTARTKCVNDEPAEVLNIVPIMTREMKDLNMDSVNDFFNPIVGEGSDFQLQDAQEQTNALKRAFNRMYSDRPIRTDY